MQSLKSHADMSTMFYGPCTASPDFIYKEANGNWFGLRRPTTTGLLLTLFHLFVLPATQIALSSSVNSLPYR